MSKSADDTIAYELNSSKASFRMALLDGSEVSLDEDGTTTYSTADRREQAALDAAHGVKRVSKATDKEKA